MGVRERPVSTYKKCEPYQENDNKQVKTIDHRNQLIGIASFFKKSKDTLFLLCRCTSSTVRLA